MDILGIGHQKRTGKDTVATLAYTYLRISNRFTRVVKKGFASKLKAHCYDLYGWAGLKTESFYDFGENSKFREIVLPKLNLTPRQIWINHGMAARTVYEDVWIDALLNSIDCDFLIIPDVRFPNEVARIKALGGKIVKVTRPSIPHTSDVADSALSGNFDWDSTIVNDSDLSALNSKVVSVIEELFF